MDKSSLIFIILPVTAPMALLMGISLPLVAGRHSGPGHPRRPLVRADALKRIGAAKRKVWPPKPAAHDVPPEYLYVSCVRTSSSGTRRWVQEVPIVRKTAKLIYYTSETWDRHEAVVRPGCIRREQFETDTRCHGYPREHCRRGEDPCRHGYPAGVIPIPDDHARRGPAGRLFFATREAAEADLYGAARDRAGRRARKAGPDAGEEAHVTELRRVKELRRAMADAHPDRGGTADEFIEARHRYEAACRAA